MTHIKAIAKKLRGVTVDAPAPFQRRLDAEWRSVSELGRSVAPGDRHHVLLAPSGAGNIGDQAMFEAFVENVGGPITLVAFAVGDFSVPAAHRDRVSVVALPALVSGAATRDQTTLREFVGLLDGSSGFSVIGADVLDGGYSYRRSVQRTSLATYAARLGVDSRVLGFSLNEAPDGRCVTALAAAGKSGVRLLLRDPVSAERARALGFEGVEESADLVFAARTVAGAETITGLPDLTGGYALVNANSLIARTMDQVEEYRRIVRYLRERDLEVVFVPHDTRDGSDDVAECRRVRDAAGSAGTWLVDRLLEPAQVRGLAAGARVVVTGRMHLAIMALHGAVPAIPLSYQGKLSGLMRLFGTEGLSVEPRPGFAAEVEERLERVLAAGDAIRSSLSERLPRVKELAGKNFGGLPLVDASPS